ncbi:isocitrate dehydrogenase kinase/phosphatase AceK regulatory subunit [Rhodospirillaceae bacterium SYSU D60014]|uniref:isocitrate dehydrogenase kinase/phosphatase AceK regulatory subunit n=1 Tax=Virgifigura deserti TaxID=2268457 RepID=UPI0013C4A186
MIALAAQCILQEFDAYYIESRQIPTLAKQAFEDRDPGESLLLSRRRLSIYSESIRDLAAQLKRVYPLLAEDEHLWQKVERQYLPFIRGRYEEDFAMAYIHSARRMIYHDEWRPVEYSFGGSAKTAFGAPADIYRHFPGGARISPETVIEILEIPNFAKPYRDPNADAALVADRVNRDLGFDGRDRSAIQAIQMIKAGFYRNRGAYLVGRIVLKDSSIVPLVLCLENAATGIFVDAVLTSEADTHNIFSSTLANFHVTNPHYHELSSFLHSIMPQRPLGLHYSTVGFNHVGKVAVMNELQDELTASGEVFDIAVGFRGTVAIGFSAPSSAYTLKVIRDKPTERYKWGRFEGVDSVLRKYGRVHEINRTGSMLDNIIYRHIKLDKDWFDQGLREELMTYAGQTVSSEGSSLAFKHLIAQPKMIPLPLFLETAAPAEAETAIINLGHCIKNNAAANIFNKDLDGRNYGVSRFLKIFLFDYDALEPFTDVKIRTNRNRIEGEEDVPDWFFEEGVIFLPEEIEVGLRIQDPALRRLFREVHGDLLTTEYWERVQQALRDGHVPRINIYPDATRLRARSDQVDPT